MPYNLAVFDDERNLVSVVVYSTYNTFKELFTRAIADHYTVTFDQVEITEVDGKSDRHPDTIGVTIIEDGDRSAYDFSLERTEIYR